MDNFSKILDDSYRRALNRRTKSFISNTNIRKKVETVALCLRNRAGVRALLAGLLAKIDSPSVDIRKPYTDIAGETGDDRYSGRFYDERYIQQLADLPYRLPINATTAFLTPGFRTKNTVLTVDVSLEGRPAEMYRALLELFGAIQKKHIDATTIMDETMRLLVIERDQRQASIEKLVRDISRTVDQLPLSAEQIVVLISQHLACKNAARLPVLVVAAAYQAASRRLGEQTRRLQAHTAADKQTGALGDVEITLINNNDILTVYEMKLKAVTIHDINLALEKLEGHTATLRNYIFITTEWIDPELLQYAADRYEQLGGIEIAILDCLGFLRHFLHLFHSLRTEFLDNYQKLLLAEPESAVSHTLKEAFLTLRKAAEGSQ
ncbi:MAG: DNA methyltransferase [Planctomycetia bacterium]|nr:DNA methyltransferase [Planctomycetia bacterium]